jgi:hypothetical protein
MHGNTLLKLTGVSVSLLSACVRQIGTRTVAAASVALGQVMIKIIKITSTFSSYKGKNNEIYIFQTRGGYLIMKGTQPFGSAVFCMGCMILTTNYVGRMIRTIWSCYLCGSYDSHKKTAVICMGRMIRTTNSCYLYGPYDSHNTHTIASHVIIRFVSVTRRSDFLQDQNILRSTI